MLAFQAN